MSGANFGQDLSLDVRVHPVTKTDVRKAGITVVENVPKEEVKDLLEELGLWEQLQDEQPELGGAGPESGPPLPT